MSGAERPTLSWRGCVSAARVEGTRVRARAQLRAGPGWRLLAGAPAALGALARGGALNLPIHAAYSATSPSGWPQLVLSIYGLNYWGSEIILGYGRAHLPTAYGERRIKIPLFKPRPTTMFGEFMSWLTGKSPELVDPIILTEGNENYLLCTKSCGYVDVNINMISKGLKELNYDNIPGNYQTCDSQLFEEI